METDGEDEGGAKTRFLGCEKTKEYMARGAVRNAACSEAEELRGVFFVLSNPHFSTEGGNSTRDNTHKTPSRIRRDTNAAKWYTGTYIQRRIKAGTPKFALRPAVTSSFHPKKRLGIFEKQICKPRIRCEVRSYFEFRHLTSLFFFFLTLA